jgi:hypothetical protein
MSFALAVLAKLAPIVLLPFLARRVGLRGLGLAAAVVLAGYTPFLDSGFLAGFSAFARDWRFNGGPFFLLNGLLTALTTDPDRLARAVAAALLLATLAYLLVRDEGRPADVARVAAAALGALVLLSPAVMPWYVTWLLPLAVVGRESAWLAFSGLVCLAFLVMVDGRERPAVLLLEYGALAAFVTARLFRYRRPVDMKTRSAVLAVLLLGLPAGALAQGSGSHGPVVRPPTYGGDSLENFNVLRSFEGTLHAIDEKEAAVIVDEAKTGRRVSFLLDRKVKLKADKKSELGGRKDLSLADLKPGQPVKLTVRTTDAVVVELRVRALRT